MNDVLNQWAKQTAAGEGGGYQPHPNGEFPAQIVDIKQKTVDYRPVWDIRIKSHHGFATTSIWSFTDQDLQDQQKCLKTLSRLKRMYVDLGVWNKQTADAAGWDDGPTSIIGALGTLVGRPCWLVVQPHQTRPDRQIVYINAPRRDNAQTQAGGTTAPNMNPPQMDPLAGQHNMAPLPQANQDLPLPQSGSMDNIPF